MERMVLGGPLGINNETVGQLVMDMARQMANGFYLNEPPPIMPEDENKKSDSAKAKKDAFKNPDYNVVKKKYLYKNITGETQEIIDESNNEDLVVVKKKNTRKNRRKKLLSVSEENDYSSPLIVPIEIISLIMDRVDGQTLANCYNVCKLWRSIISPTSNTGSKRWMNVCIKEIPEEQFFDFLGNHEPKYWMEEVPKLDFFYIHNRWSHWLKFIEMNKKLKTLCSLQTMITYIKTSGDWILISSADGAVYGYSFTTHTLTNPILRCGEILSMHFRSNKIPEKKTPKLPGIGHDELIINLNHPKIMRLNLHDFKITFQDKVTHVNQMIPWVTLLLMTRFQTTGPFENVEINLIVRNSSTMFRATFMNGKIVEKKFGNICSLISVWNGYVIAFCHDSFKMMVLDYDFNEIKHPFNNKCLLDKGIFPSNFIGLDTFMTVAPTPNYPVPFEVHHLNYNKRYTCSTFPAITCARLYGSHLFLGTAMGSLFVYRIDTMMDLLNLDNLEKDRCETITVSTHESPIIAIDIHETKNKSSIIVATVESIIEISF